jgi:endonuclease YncB( thermonuclease family)
MPLVMRNKMRLILKTFPLVAILFCWTPNVLPQTAGIPSSQNQDAKDPCGDPAVESMLWTAVKGIVAKVVDGDTVIMSLSNRKRVRVHLVGIEAPSLNQPFGPDAQIFLERLVKGETVEVWVNPTHWDFKRRKPKDITGVLNKPRGDDLEDINLSLIEAGMARHKPSEPYQMSVYTECQYTNAEEKAHAAKRGLWQCAA